MSKEDFEKLQCEANTKARENFDINQFFAYTLENFAYRYIESSTTGDVKCESPSPLSYALKAVETSFTQIQHLKYAPIKKVIEIKKPESVLMGVFCQVHLDGEKGFVDVNTFINWSPDHFEMKPGNFIGKQERLEFSEILELRNNFANFLEPLFEVFD